MCTEKEERNTKTTLDFINGKLDVEDYSKKILKDNLAESSPIRSFTLDLAATALSGIFEKIRPNHKKDS